jgi:hypothetical protein
VRCPPIYLLTCKVCDPRASIPFPSQEERGHWASEHTAGTGHDRWVVEDPPFETKGNSEVSER